jgi:hypothetical protein
VTVLPDLFVGVWVRESIALDGGPAAEAEDVVWLQGPETFADVRLARAAGAPVTEAFGGTTGWDGKALHWAHELDWHGGFAQTDLGRIEWVDDVMVERGTMAVAGSDGERYEVAYEEIWRREHTDGPVLALGAATAAGTALHVAVDDWAITLAGGPPGTFALRLVRPGRATVERSEGGLRVPDPEDPTWCWTTRGDASHVGPAVETVSKHTVRRLPT